MQTRNEENKVYRSGIENKENYQKSLKPKTYLQLWMQALVTKFLNLMR